VRLLSRQDLLELDEESLLETAACHGVDVEGRTAAQVLDEFSDFLEDFAEAFGPGAD
jgi:hypothetical protein